MTAKLNRLADFDGSKLTTERWIDSPILVETDLQPLFLSNDTV